MPTLLLVRHGQTQWNLERRVQGQTDIPLSEEGFAQARALADELASEPLVAAYASDLVRARSTAEIVAQSHGLVVEIDPRLREKNFGSWEGLTDLEIAERFPDARRGHWGDGETTEAVSERAVAAVAGIVAQHPAGAVLVVSHGGPLRALLDHFEIEHGAIRNCVAFRVEV